MGWGKVLPVMFGLLQSYPPFSRNTLFVNDGRNQLYTVLPVRLTVLPDMYSICICKGVTSWAIAAGLFMGYAYKVGGQPNHCAYYVNGVIIYYSLYGFFLAWFCNCDLIVTSLGWIVELFGVCQNWYVIISIYCPHTTPFKAVLASWTLIKQWVRRKWTPGDTGWCHNLNIHLYRLQRQ